MPQSVHGENGTKTHSSSIVAGVNLGLCKFVLLFLNYTDFNNRGPSLLKYTQKEHCPLKL